MKYLITLTLTLLWMSPHAQTLSRQVVAGSGDYFKNQETEISLIWTLGEISTENLINQVSLQQGFHQSNLEVTVGTTKADALSSSWKAFPNPADYHLNIDTHLTGNWHYELSDALGRRLLQGKATQAEIRLDLPMISPGLFFLTIRDGQGRSASKKIHIQQ